MKIYENLWKSMKIYENIPQTVFPQTVFTLKGFWRIKGLVNQCRGCSVQRSPPIAEKTHIVFILAVFYKEF